ncbi:hypothetical protein PQX77_000594 [Marasmius sp. AFHP31]|nr:hypothetical protein PQX77_000594 [Marasmius sp. AFHP31]
MAQSFTRRQAALAQAEEALLEHEKEYQDSRAQLREAKELYKAASDRASAAKANVRSSSEEVGNRLADLKDINDKMRRLLEMDALDEWTDSDGNNENDRDHSPTPSPTPSLKGGWVYDPSYAGWGNGSGTWGKATAANEANASEDSSEDEAEVASEGEGKVELGDLSIQGPSNPSVQVEPGSKYPAYVVYYGKDSAHGLFTGWRSVAGRPGANSLCKGDNHIVKGFLDPNVAKKFYQEFVQSDASKVIAVPPCADERFIVVQGAKPGVYEDRRSMVIFGLEYGGGRVRRFVGGRGDAQAQFTEWKEKGLVKVVNSS